MPFYNGAAVVSFSWAPGISQLVTNQAPLPSTFSLGRQFPWHLSSSLPPSIICLGGNFYPSTKPYSVSRQRFHPSSFPPVSFLLGGSRLPVPSPNKTQNLSQSLYLFPKKVTRLETRDWDLIFWGGYYSAYYNIHQQILTALSSKYVQNLIIFHHFHRHYPSALPLRWIII